MSLLVSFSRIAMCRHQAMRTVHIESCRRPIRAHYRREPLLPRVGRRFIEISKGQRRRLISDPASPLMAPTAISRTCKNSFGCWSASGLVDILQKSQPLTHSGSSGRLSTTFHFILSQGWGGLRYHAPQGDRGEKLAGLAGHRRCGEPLHFARREASTGRRVSGCRAHSFIARFPRTSALQVRG